MSMAANASFLDTAPGKIGPFAPMGGVNWDKWKQADVEALRDSTGVSVTARERKQWGRGKRVSATGPPEKLKDGIKRAIEILWERGDVLEATTINTMQTSTPLKRSFATPPTNLHSADAKTASTKSPEGPWTTTCHNVVPSLSAPVSLFNTNGSQQHLWASVPKCSNWQWVPVQVVPVQVITSVPKVSLPQPSFVAPLAQVYAAEAGLEVAACRSARSADPRSGDSQGTDF